MTFKIVYTKTAVKDIKKLDNITKKKIKNKIELFISNPLGYAKKLTDLRIGEYRWRIGNYRVVFDIDNLTIVVLRIRHRKEIYKTN